MAMTNSLNHEAENFFSELLIYQMLNRTISSPRTFFAFQNEAVALYPLFNSLQNLSSAYVKKKTSKPITTMEQLMLISAFFGFSKSKLGELLGVTRQSIYNWFNNSEVDSEHSKKIKCLADIAFEVDPKPSQHIFHVYANEVIEGYEKSLFHYLRDDDINKDKVIALSRTIYEMSKERWKRIEAIPKAQYRLSDQ